MENQIIEINGVKIEVDMRYARKIEAYKVGDRVKLLSKKYGDSYESYPGIIVGFDNFKMLPTIIIAYLETSYSCASIKFAYLNSSSKDIEICPIVDNYIALEKSTIIEAMDRDITKKEEEIFEMKTRKEYFLNNFNEYFNVKSVG